MKKLLLIALTCFIGYASQAQGVSFSYLIPKNGYLSAPISPFSIRGVGIGNIFGVETGATIYNVPGLAMEDLPFTYERPLVGPHFALLIPAQAYIKIPLQAVIIKVMGGGFAWWNINTRVNTGNLDRAFREMEGWDVLNTSVTLDDKLGAGWMAGVELEFKISKKFSLTTEVQYLKGQSKSSITGSYSGGNVGGVVNTEPVDISEASIILEGIELSLGVVIKQ